jgi:tetratricopeptide (TPR) repeat protein
MNPDALLAEARQLLAAGNYAACVGKYEQLVRLVPDHPIPRAELAMAYTQVNRLDEAEALAANALRAAPELGIAHAALGISASTRNRPDLAVPYLQRAVELAPDLVIARQMLGVCLGHLGRFREAAACHETVAFLNPGHPHARFSIGMRHLYNREYAIGWREYEWRWLTAQLTRPEIPRPRWDGRDLAGKSLLVHTEQGIGDAVQLVRLLPLLKSQKRAAKLVFACQKAIHKLLANSVDVEEWFPIDEPAQITFDTYTPMLALPWLLGINEHSLPKQVPYVKPDPVRAAKWKPIADAIPGFKIGIAWQGSPTYIGDAFRSIPLKHFAALAQIPGVTLVSLQKVAGTEQIAANKGSVPIVELDGLDADGAFVDTASLLQYLNLTVCCDSALGHIAGACGVPVWIGLAIGHDWRWQADREDSPWYPTARLFRQTAFQDWDGVFARMTKAIREAMAGRATLGSPPKPLVVEPIRVEVQVGELFDKISILELKARRIRDAARLENVLKELGELTAVRDRLVPASPTLDELVKQLDEVNLAIWDNEERMRDWARDQDFGEDYIAGARSIARNNDRRAAIKRQINEMLGSRLMEEKSYGTY